MGKCKLEFQGSTVDVELPGGLRGLIGPQGGSASDLPIGQGTLEPSGTVSCYFSPSDVLETWRALLEEKEEGR